MGQTLAPLPEPVDAGTSDEDIIHDCEHALAGHPFALLILDLAVVEVGGFIQLDAPPMDGLGERNFIRVKVFPAGSANYLVGLVAEYIFNRCGDVEEAGVERNV